MAEKDTTPHEARTPGPELRLIDRRAFVGFPELKIGPGLVVHDFALQIPDVTFPMNISGGAAKYQKKKLDFGFLELSVDAEVIQRAVQKVSGKLADLDELKLHFRPGYLEVQARLRGAERAPVTFKVAFDGDGEKLAVYFYDVRFYAFSTTPAARLGALITEALAELDLLPDVERRGASGFTTRILPFLVEQAAVARGYKMPSLDQARLAEASMSSKGLRLRFSAGGLPPPAAPDDELMLALEGARAFADAEELLSQGKLHEAREAYLRLGDATEAHPFAVERLLTLLVADSQAHELALDIAASLSRRRERSATAIWAEAVVRERRGEFARASERFLALCNLARKNQEDAGAFFAAEAAARASRDHAPQLAVKALHELLGLKPDHLPSLKALARASDQAKDRAGAIRAYRRLAALARDPAEAADAHVQLARLFVLTDDDIAGARLHCEAALRLAPDHPEALYQLGDLCFRSGEFLRAVKALDRLREVAMGRHEVDRIGRANLLAGQVWETGLKQPENALLRYREAASLLPGEPEPLVAAARVAESLGKVQEAVAGYQQAVELAGPAPANDDTRKAAHQAHHALARLLKAKLGEPARAREHLESALQLDPTDKLALDELLPYFRASGKAAELADACEKSAAVIDDPIRRAALWAEAGELYRGRLSQPEKAERLLGQALEADPKNRLALEGMLALAESRRDGAMLSRCLRALAELAEDPKDRVRHYRRLAVAARDLAFDLDLAVHAYREVLRIEPDDLPVLGELTAIERRRADMGGLAWALEQRARASEVHGDKRLAAAALRELGQVLDTRLGRAGEALVALEKSSRLFPDANTLMDLAMLSLRLERAGNARRALEDVLALLPKHAPPEKLAEVRARLGRACELLGDRDAARENYALAFPLRRLDDELAGRLEALYIDGHFTRELTDLWAARAQALLQAGRAHDAAPLFFKSAQTLLESGDSSGAMLRLSAALDAAPNGERAGDALEAMAQLELERGAPNEAARLFARRAALATEGRVAAKFFFKAAALTRDTQREQPFLNQSLEQDGTFVPARLRRAELLESINPREALSDLEVVLAADPKDEELVGVDLTALTRRAAVAAVKSGQFESARRMFSKFTALRPEDVEAQLELAKLHRRAGALEPLIDLLGEIWPRLSGETRASARREFAEGALTLGRTEAAMDALRSLLEEAPTDGWAAGRLLALLPADPAFGGERLELLSRLVATSSGDEKAELLSRRAELQRTRGDLQAARADLLDAAHASTRPLPLLRALAELARQSQDDAAELSTWRQVLGRAGKDSSLQQDAAERLFTIARSRTEALDLPKALEAFELLTTLSLGPTERFDAWFGVAKTAKALNAPAKAENALLEASKQGPAAKRVEALLERAALLEARDELDGAIESFEAATELSPRHPAAIEGLKRTLRAQQDWEGLAEVLAAEAAQTPKSQAAALYTELASLYLDKLEQPGPGEAALRRVIALDSTDATSRRRLAALLVNRQDFNEAVALLEEAAGQLAPDEAARVLREGTEVAARAQDAGLELKLMRRAHELVPATGAELQRLASALYLRGAMKEALPLQQALAAKVSFDELPEEAEHTLLRLADLAEHVGDLALAESTLKHIVTERPLQTQAVERLAQMLAGRDLRASIELLARHTTSLSASPRTAERLLQLARRANTELKDPELAARLFEQAASAAEAPLPVRLELIELLRETGRTGELMAQLLQAAQAHLTQGDVDAALAAYAEEAGLAEGAGRIDDALRTLTAMAEVGEEEGLAGVAIRALIHRAELLRDSKLDLEGAEASLSQAWNLEQSSQVAAMAMALAQRRGDREAEIDWLEKSFKGLTASSDRAAGLVTLARLHLGLNAGQSVADAAFLSPDQAEAALNQALTLQPRFEPAESLLLAVLERQNRVADIAAYYEDASARAKDPNARAQLLLQAAELYKNRANRPAEAAAALLAARSALPDDLALTARVADLLHELGRHHEAADFDGLLLEADPFHPSFERHRAALLEAKDDQGLAGLLSRRAEKQNGATAAESWLAAAAAFRRAGAVERAQLCEAQAFEAAPSNLEAFTTLLERTASEPRRQAEILVARARAVPDEASSLLRRRAEGLTRAQEALLAATAWDDFLAVAPDDLAALEARAELAAQGGGPRAAQPYDRRLVNVGGDALSAALKLKTWFRLGQAALEAQAWKDAVDALETVVTLDENSSAGQQALSLLSEPYARLRDAQGQYRTTIRLARMAEGAEAEALNRQALALFDEPERAIEALDVLVAAHPGDVELYEKGVRAYRSLGRLGDLMKLHERHAESSGGSRAARALLAAAALVETELGEPQRALELRQAAIEADPDDLEAIHAVLAELRRRNDGPGVALQLRRVVALTRDEAEATGLRLELAALLEKQGDLAGARETFEILRRAGAASFGYSQSLTGLERIAHNQGDAATVAEVQLAAAELLAPVERSARLLEAARSFQRAGQLDRAEAVVLDALAASSSREGLVLLVELTRGLQAPVRTARALVQLGDASKGASRTKLLLETIDAWSEAGERAAALEALERVLRDVPNALTPQRAGEWFTKLGATDKALAVAFAPAMSSGAYEQALALAEAAEDEALVTQALRALAELAPDGQQARRLADRLRAAKDLAGLQALAEKSTGTLELELWHELLFTHHVGDALEYMLALDTLGSLVEEALEARDAFVLSLIVPRAGELPVDQREAFFVAVADQSPARRPTMLRELATLRQHLGRHTGAVDALTSLISIEENVRLRASLQVERGVLLLRDLNEPKLARVAFELALADDSTQVMAVRELIELYRDTNPDRFASMVERLMTLSGPEAGAPYRVALADAYEGLGRLREAFRLIGELEETPERVQRRAALAEKLGLSGEALVLREKIATSNEELESILRGYLDAQLVPFAVKLGERLIDSLAPQSLRFVAERLSGTTQGAQLAVRIWPKLMPAALTEADSWTMYAEALRGSGRPDAATLADGFGAALTATTGPTPAVATKPLEVPGAYKFDVLPPGLVAVNDETMPRLASALSSTLDGLGLTGITVSLDVSGGVEAWLGGETRLVIGAGALAAFGQAELTYLVALAFSLGEHGRALSQPADVPGLVQAAKNAFAAVPNSLAAARVLAQLDGSARGGDPAKVDVAAVLRESPAFKAIAGDALSILAQ